MSRYFKFTSHTVTPIVQNGWLQWSVLSQLVTTINMNIDSPPKKAKGNTYRILGSGD
jgi:hypothetical protein